MERALGCRDVGVDCSFVARGKTDEEVLKKAQEHGEKVHGMGKMTKEQLDKMRKKIHNA